MNASDQFTNTRSPSSTIKTNCSDASYDKLSHIARTAARTLSPEQKKKFGAYLTPGPLANLIANMSSNNELFPIIGDHGAGSALLSTMTAISMLHRPKKLTSIHHTVIRCHKFHRQRCSNANKPHIKNRFYR